MAARTPRTNEPVSEMVQEPQGNDVLEELSTLHNKLDKVERMCAYIDSALRPMLPDPEHSERAKVLRRRSLDDMQFAMKRLASGEPRPADDDSPQVIQDAINEVIALRQIVSDMMQASSNVYQHGLTAIRDMTSR